MTVCWVHPPLWWGLREETWGRGGSFLIFLAESLWNTSVEMTEFALPGLKSCCSVSGKSSWFPCESYSRSFSPCFHLEDPSSSVHSFFSVYFTHPIISVFYLFIFPWPPIPTIFLYPHPGGLPAARLKGIPCSHPCESLRTERADSAVKIGQEKIGKWSKNVKSRILPFSWKPFWLWALPLCPCLH